MNNKLIWGNNFFEMLDDDFSINNNLVKFNNDSNLNFDSCILYINENYMSSLPKNEDTKNENKIIYKKI